MSEEMEEKKKESNENETNEWHEKKQFFCKNVSGRKRSAI